MNQDRGKILLVDDDDTVRRALKTTLSAFGFCVEEADSGEEAIRVARSNRFDAVLLDLNMPGMGGMSACQELRRATPGLPILMLTVRDNQEDIIRAFDVGADDYITKPFHVRELTARLGSAVRRSRLLNAGGTSLRVGEIELDPERKVVLKRGVAVRLTPTEYELLYCLMRNAGMPLPHARLLCNVWGPEYGGELEYLRTFIRQLRIKLEDNPAAPVYLVTEPYVGYRMSNPSHKLSQIRPVAPTVQRQSCP
jgi:two-component system, OmpR family, KDP operon response regulator KdpE